MKFLSILLFALGALSINAQSIDEELGFIYVKADYLLETDRYEDAIREFTKIIAKDPSYKDALYKRGKAKYAIAAFKGTRNDLLQSFELVGITPEALTLFGNTLKNLDQHDAATITLNTASMINSGGNKSSDSPSRQSKDTSSDTDSDEKGDIEKLEDKLSSILDDLLPDRKTDGEDKSDDTTTTTTTTTTGGDTKNSDTSRDTSDSNTDSGTTKSEKIEVNVEEKEEDKPDTSVNEIFVDEDLTIQIKNGLGSRKILDQPNILILSDKSGEVSIDVCVDANGKVTSAEYNKNSSSISTQSLVSLAVRKSKEFWFKKSDSKETCGSIVFKITGGA